MATTAPRAAPHRRDPDRRRGRSGHARHHRGRAQERALRDGRRALPLGDEPRDPRAARRVPDDHGPARRMVVGQFGAYISEMMEDWDRGVYPGDVILTSDPFKCSGSISHTNDWLVLLPIFYEDELVGWSSQFGHQMDAGGPLPGLATHRCEDDLRGGHHHPAAQDHRARRGAGGRPAPDPEQRPPARDEPRRPVRDRGRLPRGRAPGDRAVQPLRQGHLPGRARGAAAADVRGDAHADPARDPRAAAELRGLHRRRRPRQRAAQDEADALAGGRPRLLRLDGNRSAGPRTDQLLPLRRHVQDVHRGLPDHGERPPDPLQRRLLPAAARRPARRAACCDRASRPRSAAAPTASPGSSTCSAARSASRRPSSTPRPATAPRPTCCTRAGAATASSSTPWRSCTAAFRAGRSATAWTVTRGGRSSRTSRPSTSRSTTRCASTGTPRSGTRAAPACIAAATASRSATSTSSRVRSRSTTIAG